MVVTVSQIKTGSLEDEADIYLSSIDFYIANYMQTM